jgi:hypothetical protein
VAETHALEKDPNRFVVYVAAGAALLFVVALLAMIARELVPHHALASSGPRDDEEAVTAPVVAPAAPAPSPVPVRAIGAAAHAVVAPAKPEPAAVVDTPSSRALANIVTDPRATRVSNVTKNPRNHTETFAYERVPPFGGAELTRDPANPAAWQFGSLGDVELDDLAPRGGVHQAVVQKDDKGEEFATWYAIEAGPLAPAYAAKVGPETRIISRAYLEANRGDFPASFTSVLDH